MKLKDGFITHEVGETQFLVPVGTETFNGIVRNNKTAAFIIECLKTETTEEEIIDAMCARYDAPREVISRDLGKVLDVLREIGALEG